MSGGIDLAKSQLVVIFVVEDIEKIGEERVDFFDLGKFAYNDRKAIMKVLLRKFHFTHVKITNPRYLIMSVNYSGGFPLGL